MRKALIAAIVAAALFAVGAFAAEFTVNAEDTASGTDGVDRCTDVVDIDFEETFQAPLNDWSVSGIDVGLDAENDCAGAQLTLVIQNSDDAVVLTEARLLSTPGPTKVTIAPNCASEDTTCTGLVNDVPTHFMVEQVWNAAVLIDGIEYTSIEVP